MSDTATSRQALVARLFPAGIPRLWCPTLTHFAAAGGLDAARIGQHLRWLAPQVKGLLVPGSTGEGWQMSDAEIRELLAVVLDAAQPAGIRVLVGVLKTDVDAMLTCLRDTVSWLTERTGAGDAAEALARAGVVGFTVCPPKGHALTQAELSAGLEAVLDLGHPTALYQLPQVTENELAPETVADLAARYPGFYLFKDTSGEDRVAAAGLDLGGVFLVRGAERGYARWPQAGGGPYDGLLLSTANVFASQYGAMLALLDEGRGAEAAALAERVERAVDGTFGLVGGFPTGNAFTNANKTLDHVMAYGPAAAEQPAPLLHDGTRLPQEWIAKAVGLLTESHLLPTQGYLA